MRARAWVVGSAAGAVVVGVAHAFDRALLGALEYDDVYGDDWGRALRVLGYVPTWIVVALVFVLIDRGNRDRLAPPVRDAYTRGAALVVSALSAGAVAEGLKLVIRRERPSDAEGYTFRAFGDGAWSTGGLGLPSSHAAVAAGACAALALLHPRAWPVFALLAIGCAATRVMAGAHYPSDVALGMVVGCACAGGWWALHTRNLRRDRLAPRKGDA
ncbi:MAG: phosphatase PAP2 family protein [Planctomycetota bacterium]